MELILNDNKIEFSVRDPISDANSTIVLYAKVEADIFGILTLSNNATKVIEFVKFSEGKYKARLYFESEDIPYIKDSTFHLRITSVGFETTTNKITPLFNLQQLKYSVRTIYNQELAELKAQIVTLKRGVEALAKGKAIGIKIKSDDSYIKEGMIPVALPNGEFIAAYPFNDHVKSINGVQAVGGEVNLDCKDIDYNGVTLEQYIKNLSEAINSVDKKLDVVAKSDAALRKRLDDLELAFGAYKNSGLV